MNISSLLTPDAVVAALPVAHKRQALFALSNHASKLTGIGANMIYATLNEREQKGVTGVGGGVCIPHARLEKLDCIIGVFARLIQPIIFGAADGKPVDLMFLLLTPATSHTDHLKALACISHVLRNKEYCEALRRAKDAEAIYQLLTMREAA